MAMAQQKDRLESGGMSALERLELRVSSMINHPVAQIQRWVTIHRLVTDGEREWDQVTSMLSETDAIDMKFNDDDSVTLRWDPLGEEERVAEVESSFEVSIDQAAPF